LLETEIQSPKVAPLYRHVFTAADAAWSEYFANKYSHTGYSSLDMHPKFLADVVPAVVKDVREAIIAYRTHSKIEEVLSQCRQKVHFLFQCFGYAAGRLSASGATLAEVAPDSVEALRAACLSDVWQGVYKELERLDAGRDSWTAWKVYEPLMAHGDAVFKLLGLRYHESGDGVGVDIPFTPETMPDTPFAQLLARMSRKQ
jgi:hypothetical protein